MDQPAVSCASCGELSAAGKKFCSECGASLLAGSCASCRFPLAPGARYCAECGTPVLAPVESAAESVRTPVAERRVCSVLFCDLVGFTPLSETRDPEAVRELLSRYFEVARTVVGRYGGVVEKFIGDAVMAVWGTPIATEGDTERAVRAALDLVAAVAALGDDLDVTGLAARAGVVTGEVAVTLGASNEGMVAGDAVNTAARVQSTASAGTVLVDIATQRLAQASVAFTPAGEHELKGKTEPQQLWRAVRVLSAVGGAQRVDGLEAPLTGRDAELRLVRELFHATVERRRPRLVAVSGPAGVGKSRLGWEFEKYIDGLMLRTAWHRGRCLSYGDGVAFWALAEIVRQRLGIAEDDPIEVSTERLVERLDELIPDAVERAYVGLRLGRLLGVRRSDDAGQELAPDELFAGWRLFFERLAEIDPVVILVEDVQYADAGLLDFLDHLVDWSRALPIFVLAFSRPDVEVTRPGWGAGRNRTLLSLDPLDDVSMVSLLDALVPGMPAEAAGAIAAHAQGIPLFAVETIRSLIDRDIVVPREGTYRLLGDVGALSVPESLHGLFASRLDALAAETRGLVADAAVLGSTFPVEALVAVSGRDDAGVRVMLADLTRREVLEVTTDPLSPQRGTYRFANEMLRQVAYDTLSRRDRKARHLRVAAHLRSTFASDGEEVVDVLARHYLDALVAVPDDTDVGELRSLALGALTRAGERARRTGAQARAATSFAAAAELLAGSSGMGSVDEVGRQWELAGLAAFEAANLTLAIDYAGRAEAAFRQAGEHRQAARARILAANALRVAGRLAEARVHISEALAVLRESPDTDTVLALWSLSALETLTSTSESERVTAEALELGQNLNVSTEVFAILCTARGIHHAMNGRRTQAAAYYREGDRLAQQAGDNTARGRALLLLSDVLGPVDPPGAIEAARAAAEHLRRTGVRYLFAVAVLNHVWALLSTDDWEAIDAVLSDAKEMDQLPALDFARAIVAIIREGVEDPQSPIEALRDGFVSEDPQDNAGLAVIAALRAVSRQDAADALRHARAALVHHDQLGIGSDTQRWAWAIAARAAHELDDADSTTELLGLLDLYSVGSMGPGLDAERLLTEARRVAAASGEGALFDAAIAAMRTQATPYHLAHGLLDHAAFLLAAGDDAAGQAAIDEAHSIGERLGCRPLLERAARVGGSQLDRTAAELVE